MSTAMFKYRVEYRVQMYVNTCMMTQYHDAFEDT